MEIVIVILLGLVVLLLAVVLRMQWLTSVHLQTKSMDLEPAMHKLEILERLTEGMHQLLREEMRTNREESSREAREGRLEMGNAFREMQKAVSESLLQSFRDFKEGYAKSTESLNALQREMFSRMDEKQERLITNTGKQLDEMRQTVDEKLQKTLNERIGQSFEVVGKQLQAVQEGLGEMKNLAQDVGGLKKVLSNVKQRGGIGEVQLGMLLEQMLSPEQFESNVRTKPGSSDVVEFAIRLPGRGEPDKHIYLPIDAKFPRDTYETVIDAYETADPATIESATKILEQTIRKMAKDIRDKYLDPPNTTDFAIMFLPFEGIYAEVIRRSALIDQLQREFKVVVTGPTTLTAILNSLQMGFRTLHLQKRSSEVWTILGAVKTEFEKFGGLLEKAQRNITTAGGAIDELIGKRTNAINRKLKDVESLPAAEAAHFLPDPEE
jgi:DNA recombination protein RmuC